MYKTTFYWSYKSDKKQIWRPAVEENCYKYFAMCSVIIFSFLNMPYLRWFRIFRSICEFIYCLFQLFLLLQKLQLLCRAFRSSNFGIQIWGKSILFLYFCIIFIHIFAS